MNDEPQKTIDERFPRPGLMLEAELQQIAIFVGEGHGVFLRRPLRRAISNPVVRAREYVKGAPSFLRSGLATSPAGRMRFILSRAPDSGKGNLVAKIQHCLDSPVLNSCSTDEEVGIDAYLVILSAQK
jgi:hypothetical protein